MTISGGLGRITNSGSGEKTLLNQGTIHANESSQTLTLATNILVNQGILKASNGGRLTISNLTSTTGNLIVDNSSSVNVTGDYNQNQGTTNLQGGNLDITGNANINDGSLTGIGAISANTLTNDSLINPGNDTPKH